MPPTIRFRVSLTCTNCGSLNDARSIDLNTPELGNDPIDTSAYPGQALELTASEFENAYLTLRAPSDDAEEKFSAVELWGCNVCHRLRAARLAFRRRTRFIVEFVGATVVQFPTTIFDEVNYMTRQLDRWLPLPGDDVERLAAFGGGQVE